MYYITSLYRIRTDEPTVISDFDFAYEIENNNILNNHFQYIINNDIHNTRKVLTT